MTDKGGEVIEDRVMIPGKLALVKCLLASFQDVCSSGVRGVTHRGHVEDTLYLQWWRLSGVGRQSAPALSINDNCPTGRSVTTGFKLCESGSSTRMSLNFDRTCR